MRTPWTLKRRLVVSVVALLAVASVIIGVVSVALLDRTLTAQLDEQLLASSSRGGGPGDADDFDPGLIGPQFLDVGVIAAVVGIDGVVDGLYVDSTGGFRALSIDQSLALGALVTAREPRSVDLPGLGDYRAVARQDRSGRTVISALPLAPVRQIVLQLVAVIGIVTAIGIALAALASQAIVKLALRPLDRVVATAATVSELSLDRGDVALAVRVPEQDADARTEVGQVGAALNRMLGHVGSALAARQASEKKVRQFVADASHELRTPLASIRGYAELTRRGPHDLPPDVAHAIGRVESEATRMTTLVEDLLLLARLDEGRDLERRPVDLSRLLIDTVSDAHAAGPDHEWVLDLPEEPIVIAGDAQRLHQVMANLLANARVHTPAGTKVTVEIETVGMETVGVETVGMGHPPATVRVHVTDGGPGIPIELQHSLFERFARGDSSRSRAAGSTGLGLAIVQAVVQGHGGVASVSSVPGRTRFTIELPAPTNPPQFP